MIGGAARPLRAAPPAAHEAQMAKVVTPALEPPPPEHAGEPAAAYGRRRILWLRTRKACGSWAFWLGLAGVLAFFVAWDVAYRLGLPRMEKLESPLYVFREFTLPPRGALTYNPALESKWGYGIWSKAWYVDIGVSVWRIFQAFAWSLLGIPLGLLMGWKRSIRDFVFAPFELLRPIPPIAWVPLAIIMFPTAEAPIVFLCAIASFFAVTLNTLLGVESIDPVYFRAARCLGSSEWQIFRHVIVPGAMPFIFTGVLIGLGVAWFSLVGGEIIAGTWGLGYRTMDAYMNVSTPVLLIAMFTIGFIGLLMGVGLRMLQRRMLAWKRKTSETL
jgi:NitT/TauT family transport system permease protein